MLYSKRRKLQIIDKAIWTVEQSSDAGLFTCLALKWNHSAEERNACKFFYSPLVAAYQDIFANRNTEEGMILCHNIIDSLGDEAKAVRLTMLSLYRAMVEAGDA